MEPRDRCYLLFFSTSSSRGFSWWELIVTIGILGTLLAIVGPEVAPLFRCPGVDKAVNLPTQKYLAAVNQAQQTYFRQHHHFAISAQSLDLPLASPYTQIFTYSNRSTSQAIYNYAIARHSCVLYACNRETVRSFVGAVFIVPTSTSKTTSTVTILCQTNFSDQVQPPEPFYQGGKLACGIGTTKVLSREPGGN